MKKLIVVVVVLLVGVISEAQIKSVKEEANRQGTNRVNTKIDKGVNSGLDAIENGIGGLFGKKKHKSKKAEGNGDAVESTRDLQADGDLGGKDEDSKLASATINWSRYDFVPGDEVIFEDAPADDEENGEFPSRWDLKEGNAEIMQVDGETVIVFPQGGEIVPYLKDAANDYLPDVFTIEFDAFFIPGYARRFFLYLFDRKNQSSGKNSRATLYVNSIAFGESEGTYPGSEGSNYSKNGGWRHFSVAFTRGKVKMYLDDVRLINIPRYSANPTGISIECEGYSGDGPDKLQCIKNVRIAQGGVKYYDRVLTDGKIVCNGIRFDVNKATLKAESMGPINEILSLMQKQPDLNFSIEGHTDSDGDTDRNQLLSEQRAEAVKKQLIAMGIAAERLRCKGWGESKPISDNSTPEGKANNRRVEFVKF